MVGVRYHKDLDVWKLSMELAATVYRATESFPKHEMYGLVSQMRRAAVSVPSNIAEGAGRQTRKEFVQFLYVALGSSTELETQVELANMLGYLTDDQVSSLVQLRDRIGKMIFGLIKSIKR